MHRNDGGIALDVRAKSDTLTSMMKRIMDRMPSIKAVMTPFPHVIDVAVKLSAARDMMAQHKIRHLPVIDGDALVGVLSMGDLDLSATDAPSCVGDARISRAYIVELSEPLDRVLFRMAEQHIESALVVKGGKLAGIFTMTDACRCFGDFLRKIFPESGSNDAA